MSEKEMKNENEITETPVSEITENTTPEEVNSKEEAQNNKDSETTVEEKVEVQLDETSEIKEEVTAKEDVEQVVVEEQLDNTTEDKKILINTFIAAGVVYFVCSISIRLYAFIKKRNVLNIFNSSKPKIKRLGDQ